VRKLHENGDDFRLAACLYAFIGRCGNRKFCIRPGATTLPMLIFSKVRLGVTPDFNALASIIIMLVAAGVVLAAFVNSRQQKPGI